MTLLFALSLFFLFLFWFVYITILVNQAVAEYRRWRRSGREMDPGDRDMIRLCYVVLMVAMWLGWW